MRHGSPTSLVSLSQLTLSPEIEQPRGPLHVSTTANLLSAPHCSADFASFVQAASSTTAHPSFSAATSLLQVSVEPLTEQPPLHAMVANFPSFPQKTPVVWS